MGHLNATGLHTMSRKITIKVTRNLYGNWRGFVTGQESVQLGCEDWWVKEWTSEALKNNPGAVLSDKSDLSMADIEAHRK